MPPLFKTRESWVDTYSRSSSRSSFRSFARRRSVVSPRSDRCSVRPAESCGPDGTTRSCRLCRLAAPCRWTIDTRTRFRFRRPAYMLPRWSPETEIGHLNFSTIFGFHREQMVLRCFLHCILCKVYRLENENVLDRRYTLLNIKYCVSE